VFPDRQLVDVPLTHPIYHIVYDFPKGLPKIHEHDGKPARGFGIFLGDRLAVYYSYSSDLGNGWEDPRSITTAGAARSRFADGHQSLHVRRHQPSQSMTVLELVDRERARLRRLHVLVGVALAIGATCLVLAAGASILGGARWMSLPRPVPFLVWLVLVAADAAVVWWTVRRLATRATRNSVAAAIERSNRCAPARCVASSRSRTRVPWDGVPPRRCRRNWRQPALGSLRVNAAACGAVCSKLRPLPSLPWLALGWTAPTFNDGMAAIIRPVHAWQGTLLPKIAFRNLPTMVLRGEMLRLDIDAAQRSVVTLSQRMPGEGWKTEIVPVDRRRGAGTVEIGPLRGDLTIVATDGRSLSDTAVVRVTDRPFVGAVSMRATYPSYLGRTAEGLPIGEPARVPQGTVIDVAGRASTALQGVRLANTGDTISLNVNDRAFSGRFEAKKAGRWSWIASGLSGPISDVPLPIELEIVPDSAPRVELVSPATDTIVAGDDRVGLHATVTDDHGIASVELQSWKQSSNGRLQPAVTQRLRDTASTVWDGSTVLDLATRGLEPGDALHVKIVAVDNSPWAQRAESRELLLKFQRWKSGARSRVRRRIRRSVRRARWHKRRNPSSSAPVMRSARASSATPTKRVRAAQHQATRRMR
jgi:hypothetical protein